MRTATLALLALLAGAPALAQTVGPPVTLTPPAPRSGGPSGIVVQPLGPPPAGAAPSAVAPAGIPTPAPAPSPASVVPAPAVALPAEPPPESLPPVAPEDRALNSGSLTVLPTGDSGPNMPIVADNGFPFDVRLTVDTVECSNIRAADCGTVVRDRLVRAGSRQTVHTVQRIDVTRTSFFAVRIRWEPANVVPREEPAPPGGPS